MFLISQVPIIREELSHSLSHQQAGALAVFEGWVRNHNEGKPVKSLEYQIYHELAIKEGEVILREAREKFNLHSVKCVHREGHLLLGETAVWIGATASHRDDAFKATRYIIDQIKLRLPIWKKEHYTNQKPEWVFCRHHSHHVHFTQAEYYQKQTALLDQAILKCKKVLVIGAGGLGCPALVNLATAGVGNISIVDSDRVHISNIHRQPLYSPHLAGEKKAVLAQVRLKELNPFISVTSIDQRVDASNAEALMAGFDLVLDCTDNLQTKFLLHDSCYKLRIPLISASIYKFEGQLRTFVPGSEHGCLRCFIPQTPDDSLLGNCNDFGVIGATTSVLGSLQAAEAIQFLQNGTNSTIAETLYYDLKNLSQFKLKNTAVAGCPACKGLGEIKNDDLEISEVNLADAEIIDIRELHDDEILAYVSSAKKTVLSCRRGVRSKRLAQQLRELGHKNIYSLRGGQS